MAPVAFVGRNKAANGGRFRHAPERRKRSASSAYSGLRLGEDFHGNTFNRES